MVLFFSCLVVVVALGVWCDPFCAVSNLDLFLCHGMYCGTYCEAGAEASILNTGDLVLWCGLHVSAFIAVVSCVAGRVYGACFIRRAVVRHLVYIKLEMLDMVAVVIFVFVTQHFFFENRIRECRI